MVTFQEEEIDIFDYNLFFPKKNMFVNVEINMTTFNEIECNVLYNLQKITLFIIGG